MVCGMCHVEELQGVCLLTNYMTNLRWVCFFLVMFLSSPSCINILGCTMTLPTIREAYGPNFFP